MSIQTPNRGVTPHAPNLLEIENLKTWFPIKRGVFARTTGYVRAVDGVSLTLARGETLGIVGESGCGKSTVARSILRLAKPCAGTIKVNGSDISTLRAAALRALRRTVQVVFQDPYASLNPRHTVLEILTEALIAHKLITHNQRQAAATKLLTDVGLPPDILTRYPHAFSGGQRQRLCIARALALDPQLLICDEAVSALDLSIRAQVLNLLQDLQARRGLAYLFITHDIAVVQHLANRLIVMYLGRVVESGDAQRILAAPAHPYTQLLMRAVPQIGVPLPDSPDSPEATHVRPEVGCLFAPRCPLADQTCRTQTPPTVVSPTDPSHHSACFKAKFT